MEAVILKKGKEKAIRHHHHWIFSGAIQSYPSFENGDILPVQDNAGNLLGSAYFNRKCTIAGRMVAFDATPPLDAIEANIDQALAYRKSRFHNSDTNAYRLINAEGDALPGLIVDTYAGILVMQISTRGIEKLRPWLVEKLISKTQAHCVYEKSTLAARKEEGLDERFEKVHFGELPEQITILENGLQFVVSPRTGQKTGFFLDQREMRQQIRQLANGKKVLNCFSYTGGFSVAALAGGAKEVFSVDISAEAIACARQNVGLNGFETDDKQFITADVFDYLRTQDWNADLVILDPPAFAKKQKDVIPACRGYKDINRIALLKIPKGSLLLTCSCSYFVDEQLFQQVIFQAAYEAKRQVRVVGKHRLADDHPINIYHPEGNYLKSLLLYVD